MRYGPDSNNQFIIAANALSVGEPIELESVGEYYSTDVVTAAANNNNPYYIRHAYYDPDVDSSPTAS